MGTGVNQHSAQTRQIGKGLIGNPNLAFISVSEGLHKLTDDSDFETLKTRSLGEAWIRISRHLPHTGCRYWVFGIKPRDHAQDDR